MPSPQCNHVRRFAMGKIVAEANKPNDCAEKTIFFYAAYENVRSIKINTFFA